MYSDRPCLMWIERISAVFLFVFSCLVQSSLQPCQKSLVTEVGAVFGVEICTVIYVILNCCFTLVWFCNCQTDKLQEKAGKFNGVSGCQS